LVEPHPEPFLEIRVERGDLNPELRGFCAGFELGSWRAEQLARHLIKWLPEFALKYSEWIGLSHEDAVELIGRAARVVYTSPKFANRGEIGELLLHALIRQHFGSTPAISKYYYKDSSNDTVKGFDAIHVVPAADGLELWLGESKFYRDVAEAVAQLIPELEAHAQRDYLRSEFAAILNKVDDTWEHASLLRTLINENVSLDQIIKRIKVPVLITYESEAVSAHSELTEQYKQTLSTELLAHHPTLMKLLPSTTLVVLVILVPLASKANLQAAFDERLKQCQQL